MSGSLKDQLLALGLKASTPEPEAKKSFAKRRHKRPPGRGSGEIPLDLAFRVREQDERRRRTEALAEKREQERRRRDINRKLRGLVERHALREDTADCKRHFLFKGRIRSVLATPEQIRAINTGQLGIVYLRGNYHILPAEQVQAVQKFAPEHVPDLRGEEPPADEQDHPVPDDLIW